jgi:hypothetical protein
VANFLNLIIKIFKSHGFEINSTSNYGKYILATKDNINLSIGFSEPEEEASVGNLRNFFRMAKKDNADRLIYILPNTYQANVERFADDRNIQLWDRERFEREIGRAVVTDIDKADEADDILGSGDMTSTVDDSEASDDIIPIMVPVIPFSDDSESTTSIDDLPGVSTVESGDSEAQIPEIKDFQIVKPIVSKDDASTMANKIVKGFRFNLELIPYYIFDYSCKFDVDEKKEDTAHFGVLGINGLTSNIEDWSKHTNTTSNIKEPHTKLDVKFTYDKAVLIAKQAVIEINTKMVETKEEFDSTIVFEKKKLKPKDDAITINSKGIHYLPVWCIEGSNGLMIIDASSGKIIKEDIFRSASFQNLDSVNQEPEFTKLD